MSGGEGGASPLASVAGRVGGVCESFIHSSNVWQKESQVADNRLVASSNSYRNGQVCYSKLI